jgi:Zn-dependent protease
LAIDLIFNNGLEFWQKLVLLVFFAVAIILALTLHEFAHAWAAVKCGDYTPKAYGRLTINPLKHFDPLGLLAFVFIGFGWAKPMPVNPFNYRNFRRGNALVSLAGVIANLIVGITASLLYVLWVYFFAASSLFIVGLLFYFIMMLNFSLMVFNLLPIPPLDGFQLLNSFTKPNNRFMAFMRQYGMVILLIVLITGAASGIIETVIEFLTGGLTSLWLAIFHLLGAK